MKKENLPQLTRLEATVHGEVQRAGYRYIVQDTARKFNVKGYVQNMPDGTVKIIAEAPKKTIEKFIKTLQIREPPIHVDRIETKHTNPTSEFEFFSIKYGDLNEEMGEGFGTGLKYVNLSRAETRQGFQNLSSQMGRGVESVGTEMRQGFGSLKNEIGGMRQDMNNNFQDMSKKYDAISNNLGQAVKIIQDESVRTRNELIRAVDNLSKLVEEFVKEKHK
jgi:acylphosphatase